MMISRNIVGIDLSFLNYTIFYTAKIAQKYTSMWLNSKHYECLLIDVKDCT